MKWKRIIADILPDGLVIGAVICLTRGAFILHPAAGYVVLGVSMLQLALRIRGGGDG